MAVAKAVLKTKLLEILREIETSGEEQIITDHNRPVAVIKPWRQQRSVQEVFASFRGKLVVHGDLCNPTSNEWETT